MNPHNKFRKPNDYSEGILQATKAVITAVEHYAIDSRLGMDFMHWAQRFCYTLGDVETKAQITRSQLYTDAIHASRNGKTTQLKRTCIQMEQFTEFSKPIHRPLCIETLAQIYEICASHLIRHDEPKEALEYVTKARNVLDQLSRQYPDHQINSELKNSILKALESVRRSR